jgi:hypothetical protein
MNAAVIRRGAGLLVAGLVVLGCDAPEADPTIAKAMETKSDMEVAAAAVAEHKRDQAKAAKAANDALEQQRAAEIAAAIELPDPLPTKLDKACDSFVEAFDAFMLAGGEKEVLEWWDGHRKKLGKRRSKCLQHKSIEVAACGAAALRAPLPSLEALSRQDAARQVMDACLASYGKDT